MTSIGTRGIVWGAVLSREQTISQNLYAERLRVFMETVGTVHFDWSLDNDCR